MPGVRSYWSPSHVGHLGQSAPPPTANPSVQLLATDGAHTLSRSAAGGTTSVAPWAQVLSAWHCVGQDLTRKAFCGQLAVHGAQVGPWVPSGHGSVHACAGTGCTNSGCRSAHHMASPVKGLRTTMDLAPCGHCPGASTLHLPVTHGTENGPSSATLGSDTALHGAATSPASNACGPSVRSSRSARPLNSETVCTTPPLFRTASDALASSAGP